MKKDVGASLPDKTEQVLFCSLTSDQRDAYKEFLASQVKTDAVTTQQNELLTIMLGVGHCGYT